MKTHSCLKLVVFSLCMIAASAGCASTQPQSKVSSKERSEILLQVAAGALNEGDPTGALAALVEAQDLGNDTPQLHHLMALAYYFKKDTDIAIKEAKRAVELDPHYAEANNTLGKLLLDSEKFEEAKKYLEVAGNDPLYREAYKAQTNLGIIYYKTGEYPKAETEFNKAIDSNPTLACVAYYYRGEIRMNESKFETALRDFGKAVEKYCGSFEEAHMAMGIAYSRAKQYDKARRKFLEIRQLFPNSAAADKAMDELRYLP